MVGHLRWLECCNGYMQALQEADVEWQGGDVTLYVTKQWESMDPCLGRDELAESLCARIRGQTHVSNVVVGFCCSLPDQELDEAFLE